MRTGLPFSCPRACVAWLAILAVAGCAERGRYVARARIPHPVTNESVLAACHDYRLAIERGDVDALLRMAHRRYWEDRGTPSASDDYGVEGLGDVLRSKVLKESDSRYSVVGVTQQCKDDLLPGCRAAVDVVIDPRPDKRDQNQLVLEWDGTRWLFVSGM
jgi:hypothetical protein